MSKSNDVHVSSTLSFGFFMWLGGAVYIYNQPGYGFWDALIWLYYVGRYIAAHFTLLT